MMIDNSLYSGDNFQSHTKSHFQSCSTSNSKIVKTLIKMKFNNKITDNNFIVHIEGSNLTKYAKRYSEVSFKEEIDFNIDVSYIFCINLDFVFY